MKIVNGFEVEEHSHVAPLSAGGFEISCEDAFCPGVHAACGHAHWAPEDGCPKTPCGNLTCCGS